MFIEMGESTLNVYILFRSLSPPNNVEPKAYLSKLRCIEKFYEIKVPSELGFFFHSIMGMHVHSLTPSLRLWL